MLPQCQDIIQPEPSRNKTRSLCLHKHQLMFTVNISLCINNSLSHSHQTCTLVNRDTFLVNFLIFFCNFEFKIVESYCIWYYYEYLYILFNFLELFFLFVAFFHEIFWLIYTFWTLMGTQMLKVDAKMCKTLTDKILRMKL